MEKREDRRDRTIRYAEHARSIFLRAIGEVLEHCQDLQRGRFHKGKSVGCGCRRHQPGRPKITGFCGGLTYQASVRERIAGRRACHAWTRLVRSVDPLDVEL